jgi:Zn-dependent protease with chaperone function
VHPFNYETISKLNAIGNGHISNQINEEQTLTFHRVSEFQKASIRLLIFIIKHVIIWAMKNILQTDRLIISVGGIFILLSSLFLRQQGILFQIVTSALFVILLIRYLLFLYNDSRPNLPDSPRSQEASKMLSELVDDMHIEKRQIPLRVLAQLKGAQTDGKTVEIGSSLLFGLNDADLKGILAHELGHIKKGHPSKSRQSVLVFLPAFISLLFLPFVSTTKYLFVVLVLLILFGILMRSFLSWQREFEADAEGTKCVGPDTMAHALEEASKFIYRPGGTLDHPSFKNRILRVSPSYILTDETLRKSRKY